MSIANTAAQAVLSDALLRDKGDNSVRNLELELPLDKVIKFVSVGLPLLLVSLAFAGNSDALILWNTGYF
uniref:Uncharacterized protein n=1 Tax=Astyanax mexicanus TaxID=7994 RepID=A0A8B9R8M4_ASTMX